MAYKPEWQKQREAEIAKKNAQINELGGKLQNLYRQNKELQEKIEQYKELSSQLSTFTEKLKSINTDLEQAKEALEKKYNTPAGKNLSSKISQNVNEVNSCNDTISKIQTRVAERIKDFTMQKEEMQSSISALSNQIISLRGY